MRVMSARLFCSLTSPISRPHKKAFFQLVFIFCIKKPNVLGNGLKKKKVEEEERARQREREEGRERRRERETEKERERSV